MTHDEIVSFVLALILRLGNGWLGFGRILEALIDIAEHKALDPLTHRSASGLNLTLSDVEASGTFPVIHADDHRSYPLPPTNSILFSVRGKVQHVGYRFFLKAHADAMGIHGYIRNLPNGSVDIMVHPCPIDRLQRFESFILSGPEGARVDDVRTVIL